MSPKFVFKDDMGSWREKEFLLNKGIEELAVPFDLVLRAESRVVADQQAKQRIETLDWEKEAKKEAFRKYLETSGAVDALTKVNANLQTAARNVWGIVNAGILGFKMAGNSVMFRGLEGNVGNKVRGKWGLKKSYEPAWKKRKLGTDTREESKA
ncbi:hypothetical protein CR513_14998, partial [Mucuna pruriens]